MILPSCIQLRKRHIESSIIKLIYVQPDSNQLSPKAKIRRNTGYKLGWWAIHTDPIDPPFWTLTCLLKMLC